MIRRRNRFDVTRRHFHVSLLAGAIAAALATLPAVAEQRGDVGIPVSNCNDSGTGSLRDALAMAAEGDLVVFEANLGCSVVSLTSGALVIADGTDGNPLRHITIEGPGKAALSIDAQALDRVLEHHAGVDAELTLRDLTITGGRTAGSGGCIFAEGSVTLDEVDINVCKAGVVSGDTAFGVGSIRGGAIYSGNTVTMSGAHLVSNHAYGYAGNVYGGAVFAAASIVATASEVRANAVFSPGAGAYGGGLAAGDHGALAQASVTLTSSDVLDNTADSRCSFCGARGGGLWTYGSASITGGNLGGNTAFSTYGYGTGGGAYFFGAGPVTLAVVGANVGANTGDTGGAIAASGDLSIARTLLDGNVANADGGSLALIGGNLTMTDSVIGDGAAYRGAGLFIFGYGDATITNSTIGRMIASYGGAIANTYGTLHIANSTISDNDAGHGGGVYFRYPYYTIDVTSSIIAGNRGINGPEDIWPPGMTVTGSHDLIAAADGVTLPADTLRGDPMLGSLDNYGGPTMTMPPASGSPAIDAGSNPLGLAFDQRGDGFPRENGGGVDIGAFETPSDTLPDRIFESGFDP